MPDLQNAHLLLLSEGPELRNVVSGLEAVCGSVAVVNSLAQCLSRLQKQSFDLLLIEDSLVAIDSPALDSLHSACQETLLVELNLVTSNQERLVRVVQSALRRQSRLQEQAFELAKSRLRDDLGASVSGLLLQTQLLLAQQGRPDTAALERLVYLAQSLGAQLRSADRGADESICIS